MTPHVPLSRGSRQALAVLKRQLCGASTWETRPGISIQATEPACLGLRTRLFRHLLLA
jgi:hypothetical protein